MQDSLGQRLVKVKAIKEINKDPSTPHLKQDPSLKTIDKPYTKLAKVDVLNEYMDLFDCDLGELPIKYKMKINPEIKPVLCPPRRLPVALQDKVKLELDSQYGYKRIYCTHNRTNGMDITPCSNKKERF